MSLSLYPNLGPQPTILRPSPSVRRVSHQPGSTPQVPGMNRLLVALTFAAAVPSVGFGVTGTWPQLGVGPFFTSCSYSFTCVGGDVTVWFQLCPEELPRGTVNGTGHSGLPELGSGSGLLPEVFVQKSVAISLFAAAIYERLSRRPRRSARTVNGTGQNCRFSIPSL